MGEMAHETIGQATARAEAELGEQTPVPGTEETPTPTPAPSAGTENAETEQGGQTPDTVPYSRFKEVNDQLRGLKEFAPVMEAGYEPDSVARLIAFEQAYQEDPIETISGVIANLDLPDATKTAITSLMGGQPAQESATTEEESSEDEPPGWAQPIIEDHQARLKADEDAHFDGLLNTAISQWKQLDADAKLEETPDRLILTHIRAAAGSGEGFQTVEELVQAAREPLVEYRENVLGRAVTPRRGPLPVPGSGVGGSEPVKFDNLAQASRAAMAAMERGELPPLSTEEGT